MSKEIYFDNSATTKVRKEVIDVILSTFNENYGNPSSLHKKGIQAEKAVEISREIIANALKCNSSEIFFTSGGTEANNLAIKGTAYRYKRRGKHLITSNIEHPSVINTFKYLENEGFDVSYIDVNKDGIVIIEELKKEITPETILVSIMMVNNEIGSIQPVEEISRIISSQSQNKIIFHVDAVQGFGKIPIDVGNMGIDLLTISGHKFHGPKGIGALYVRSGIELIPLIAGGEQERGLRSGTENVPGIVGLGKAAELAVMGLKEFNSKVSELKERLSRRIIEEIPGVRINGPICDDPHSAPHIINISFKGIKGEILVHAMEQYGIYLSTGSACSSRKSHSSHVLKAIGCEDEELEGAIRFSFSAFNTVDEVDYCVEKLKGEVKELRSIIRR